MMAGQQSISFPHKLLDYIKQDQIKDFNQLKNWLETMRDIIEQQPKEFLNAFLDAFLKVNPKFFTYTYHFLNQKKTVITENIIPSLPVIVKNDPKMDAKLKQAVEIFRIRQEIIVKQHKNKDALLDNLASEINNYFTPYLNNKKEYKFYLTEALSGINSDKQVAIPKNIGRTYYLSANFEITIKNFDDLLKLLKNPNVKIEENTAPQSNKYYTVTVDSNVVEIRNVKLNQIREYASKIWMFNKTNNSNTLKTVPFKNKESQNYKSIDYKAIETAKWQRNQMAITDAIINDIKAHIQALKKDSIYYSSATKAKVEAFEDLIKLIKSKHADISLSGLITRWKENDSRSFSNKNIGNHYEQGKLVNISNLMMQERGFFTSYKLNEKTKSMQLIKDIIEKAVVVDKIADMMAPPSLTLPHQLKSS